MAKIKNYVRARDTNLAKQHHNRTVFVQQLRAKPWRAILLSALCIVLGIAAFYIPRRSVSPAAILALLAFGVAAWLLTVTFRRS
jgi:hypothetical protein